MTAPTLADKFPAGMRAAFCARQVRPGAVFRFFVDTTTPPKIKIMVILATCNDGRDAVAACLYVNTDVNTNCLNTPELQALQLPLVSAEHGFLDHNSYLDCSNILRMSVQKIEAIYNGDGDVYLGDLKPDTLNTAKTMTAGAKSIPMKLRRQFGLI